nr:hypothetical protein [Anaerolineales bacterium]
QLITGRKHILIIASLRWWIEYCTALSLLLSGQGYDVTLAYVPYRTWWEQADRFDLRRHRHYLRGILSPMKHLVKIKDICQYPCWQLTDVLSRSIEEQSRTDVQYTLQRETLNLEEFGEDLDLYHLRQERNCVAANAGVALLAGGRYDSVIIPNGSILEFGAMYRVTQHLGIPTVTIEFGEQRERLWLARDDEVMRLDTSEMWEIFSEIPLSDAELEELKSLYEARRGGKVWSNFARQWQSGESQGAQNVRDELNLDPEKPVVLLCTNVVGDSLALGRQVFTAGMADWLAKTVRHFANRPDAQLIVRVHPGELLGAGHPSVDIVRDALPEMPPHVNVIPPDSKINTYDLIELTQLGLVYTTTVGMEMAMGGIPVIVSGMTHYREKGFTYDPETMSEYTALIDRLLRDPEANQLSDDQVMLAMRYAYRFFFDYPFKFPWHLVYFWEDIEARSLDDLFSGSIAQFRRTVNVLAGEPLRQVR